MEFLNIQGFDVASGKCREYQAYVRLILKHLPRQCQ